MVNDGDEGGQKKTKAMNKYKKSWVINKRSREG